METTGQEPTDPILFHGDRVHRLRKTLRISQKKLGQMVGTSPSQVSLIESNTSRPSLKTAIALARVLETSLDYLTGEIENATPDAKLVSGWAGWYKDQLGTGRASTDPRNGERDDYVAIAELDTAAGTGAIRYEERSMSRVKFPTRWLRREGLKPQTAEWHGWLASQWSPRCRTVAQSS